MSNPTPLPISQEVAERLRAIRMTRGVIGDDLAKALTELGYPMSRGMLANIENGRFRTVPVDLVVTAMTYFDMNFGAFMRGPLCSGCQDDPPVNFICALCRRTKDQRGKLVKC
jgi:transcriptional regulator with XRE-family HTH domain